MVNELKQLGSESCTGCTACMQICSRGAIDMRTNHEGFWYPEIHSEKCIQCGLCEKTCPVLNKPNVVNNFLVYAAYNKDEPIRMDSSSGGMFTLLAEHVIDNGGVVFGAAFSTELVVEHICVNSKENLHKLRGSKYVQSTINSTYKQAKEHLDSGKPVMFSGTPCQIVGIISFLGKNYDNLLTVDFICHGVPSPKVFKLYKEELEDEYNSKIKKASFRSKVFGWKSFSTSFLFENDVEYSNILKKDIYMRGFLRDLFLRPSCHVCHFKFPYRFSDLTLADFWGVDEIMPDMFDDRGVSLFITNSAKGQAFMDEVKQKIIYKEVDSNDAFRKNSAALFPVRPHPDRAEFFANIDKVGISDLINEILSK